MARKRSMAGIGRAPLSERGDKPSRGAGRATDRPRFLNPPQGGGARSTPKCSSTTTAASSTACSAVASGSRRKPLDHDFLPAGNA